MRGARQLMLALVAATAAVPATAGVVYTPAANFEQDGVQRRSDLLLSNTDASQMRAATLRFIAEGAAGTQLRGDAEPVLWTGPAGSGVRRTRRGQALSKPQVDGSRIGTRRAISRNWPSEPLLASPLVV